MVYYIINQREHKPKTKGAKTMKQFEIRALVGRNGMGTIISEVINGTEEDAMNRLREINKAYGGFYSWQLYEDGIKVFDSNWKG